MTTYGTIPSSSSTPSGPTTSSPLDYIHRVKARGASALATRRPWRELADLSSFGLPPTLGEAYLRLRNNLIYFAMNYAIIVLLIVFLSLLWHPISLIVFIVTMIAWIFFYFLKDGPLFLFGREISDSITLLVLAVVTLVLLLLTNATANILVSLLIGVVVVAAHASLRKAEEMYLEEEAAGPGRWYTSISEVVSTGTSRY
ncbi:PRA1 family protein F3-like [Carex rostrata]